MSFYAFAAGLKIDKVTDFAFGTNTVGVAVLTFFMAQSYFTRQIIVNCLVLLWGIRITAYLLRRILTIGEDNRFDEYRGKPLVFLRFWIFQMISIFAICLPLIFLNANVTSNPDLNWRDFLGWALYLIGFIFETVGDHQKFLYKLDPKNKGHWCDVGLWSISRHPNYFGEFMMWWGIFSSCSSVFNGPDWATIVGPVYLFVVIMFLSGTTRLEQSADERYWDRDEYQEYKKSVSVLIPLPPPLYRRMHKVLKYFCCEWGIYSFPPEKRKTVPKEKSSDSIAKV